MQNDMKQRLYLFIALLSMVVTVSSCSDDDEENWLDKENTVTYVIKSSDPTAELTVHGKDMLSFKLKGNWKHTETTTEVCVSMWVECEDPDVYVVCQIYVNGVLKAEGTGKGGDFIATGAQLKYENNY